MRRIALVLVSLFLSTSASAEILTFEYTGVINTLRETIGNAGSHAIVSSSKIPGGVRVGDDFHGTFSLETNSAVNTWFDSNANYYNWQNEPALTSITFDKSGTTSATPYAARTVDIARAGYSDIVSINASALVSPGVSLNQFLKFYFAADGGTTLTSLAMPTNFNVADWNTAEVGLNWSTDNGHIDMSGMLTSVNRVSTVPEPESYLMLLAGFALVSGVVARKKKQMS